MSDSDDKNLNMELSDYNSGGHSVQNLEDLKRSAHTGNPNIKNFEDSVFSGNYCTGDITQSYLQSLENSRSDSTRTK